MRIVKKLMAGILGMALIFTVTGPVNTKAAEVTGPAAPAALATNQLEISVPDNKVLTFEAGKPQDFILHIKNISTTDTVSVTASPKLRSDADKWPFKTEYQSYKGEITDLAPGAEGDMKFTFVQRDNVPTARYVLTFEIAIDGKDSGQESFYVNTTAKPENKPPTNNGGEKEPVNEGNTGGDNNSGFPAEAGGFSNGDAGYSGGGAASGNGSVPRVIVTGFRTDPAEVKAGSNFNLTIQLKNTSKASKVSNLLFDLTAPTEGTDEQTSAPAFLPASGSNSIYLDQIAADGTAEISIQLNAKADLVQKPYGINLSAKYEDANAAQIEAASSISIPVKQDARFELSEFEMTPEEIAVGDEVNAACSLYNLGRIKLYNVKVTFEGKSIKKEEVFIGNVEPGATASIDAMLEGKQPTKGKEKIKMTLSYEDEAAAVSKKEQEIPITVMEAAVEDMNAMQMVDEPQKGFPLIPVLIAAAIVVVIAAVIIIRKRKKKRLESAEEEGLLDELDGSSEDEQQQP